MSEPKLQVILTPNRGERLKCQPASFFASYSDTTEPSPRLVAVACETNVVVHDFQYLLGLQKNQILCQNGPSKLSHSLSAGIASRREITFELRLN